jgi:hypothetical protein
MTHEGDEKMNETWMIIKMITGFNLNHGVFRGELA